MLPMWVWGPCWEGETPLCGIWGSVPQGAALNKWACLHPLESLFKCAAVLHGKVLHKSNGVTPIPLLLLQKPVRILSRAWETAAEGTFPLSLSFSLCNEKNSLSLLNFKIILFCQSLTPTSSSRAGPCSSKLCEGGDACHPMATHCFPLRFPGIAVEPFPTAVASRVMQRRVWLQGHWMLCSP